MLRLWTWPWLVATTLSRSLLASVLCLGLWGALPAAIGWHPTTVSSGSMLPRLHVGDVAVSRPVGRTPPTLGSVLLFDDPDHPGRLRLHRFVRLDQDGQLVTRGDANPHDDSSRVALSSVRGIATLRVPWIALPVVWARERDWLPLGLVLLGLTALAAVAGQGRRFGFPDPPPDPDGSAGDRDAPRPPRGGAGTGAPRPGQRRRLPRLGRRGGRSRAGRTVRATVGAARLRARPPGVVAAAALLALVPGTPAGAVFSATTSTSSRFSAATYFSCANAVTAFAPTLWYRMDETSSTATAATDSSSGAQTGVYGQAGKTAGATRACTRDSGQAMTFDGSSGYLSSPLVSSALPNTFTVSVWFRTTTTQGGKLIGFGNAQTGASGTYDRHIYMTDAGKLIFGVYPGAIKTITSPAAYNDGAWHQSVATLSSAGMQLYVDGAVVASDSSVTTAEGVSSGYLRIAYDNLDGWTSTPTSRFFAGTLDDAAFYPTALSATQVTALHEAGTT